MTRSPFAKYYPASFGVEPSRERGSPGVKIGAANREAVRAYFAAHLGCTNVECAQALGLSVMSVGRHVATIRKEWE